MIAHEFNNILTPLASYAQMALAAPEDRELVTKALRRCLAASEQTSSIASAILDLVRSAGVAPTGSPVADVPACIRAAVDCLGRSPEKDGIALILPPKPSKPVLAAIEPHALTHVLVNLLINARNAIDRRGTLEIAVESSDQPPEAPSGEAVADSRCSTWNTRVRPGDCAAESGWLTIVVRDSGRGMRPERLAELFTPPHLRTRTAGPTAGGTGLGMGIAKHLVEQAGGWLVVTSAPGMGTTVRVNVPRA